VPPILLAYADGGDRIAEIAEFEGQIAALKTEIASLKRQLAARPSSSTVTGRGLANAKISKMED